MKAFAAVVKVSCKHGLRLVAREKKYCADPGGKCAGILHGVFSCLNSGFVCRTEQFESFKDPLIIMLTVPLAIAGALIFMYFNDITMNIFSQIGIIMLIGLVAKNGILIVEFANLKQEAGEDKMEAIKDASLQRLRPILMTSASTILGLIPLAFASGEGL